MHKIRTKRYGGEKISLREKFEPQTFKQLLKAKREMFKRNSKWKTDELDRNEDNIFSITKFLSEQF